MSLQFVKSRLPSLTIHEYMGERQLFGKTLVKPQFAQVFR